MPPTGCLYIALSPEVELSHSVTDQIHTILNMEKIKMNVPKLF